MSRRGEYSSQYSFHRSQVEFNCGGTPIAQSPHGTLSTKGIDKAQPKRFTSEVDKTHKGDIDGSRPTVTCTSSQPRNPLVPKYDWPVETHREGLDDEVKFIRDSMDVSDIEGAKVKSPPKQSSRADCTLNVFDINFS